MILESDELKDTPSRLIAKMETVINHWREKRNACSRESAEPEDQYKDCNIRKVPAATARNLGKCQSGTLVPAVYSFNGRNIPNGAIT
jgi:hypothetical protein